MYTDTPHVLTPPHIPVSCRVQTCSFSSDFHSDQYQTDKYLITDQFLLVSLNHVPVSWKLKV